MLDPGIISLSGVIIADNRLSSSSNLFEFSIYFLKNLTFFLFLILLADEFRYFFGIFIFNLIFVKQGVFFFQPIVLKF